MSRNYETTFLSFRMTRETYSLLGMIAAAVVCFPSLAAESRSAPTLPMPHLDLDNLHLKPTSSTHSREEESIRISPFSYEVLFPEESAAISSSTRSGNSWVTAPAQLARSVSRSVGRSGYSRAEISSSEMSVQSGGLPLLSSGVSSELVRTVLVGAGYLVETDPSYKYGLPVSLGAEIGQHITLAGGNFTLGEIDFPYYSSVEQAQSLVFRLYSIGAGGLPSSLLYQSSPQDIHSGIYNVGIAYGGPVVPKDLVFSIAFNGVPSGASVGLLLPNADPTIGSTTGQVLAKDGGTWTQQSVVGGVKGAISISVTPAAVPEPQTIAMVFIAGIAFWAIRRRPF